MMPFTLKLEKRLEVSRTATFLVPVISILLALVFGAVLLSLVGANPMENLSSHVGGRLWHPRLSGSRVATTTLSKRLVKATPLMLTGLAVAVAFRMRFWNIGAEGQLVMGGIAAAAVALWVPPLLPFLPESRWVYLPLIIWLPACWPGQSGH
jgi:general nucleoside transport system permease protein